MPLEALAYRVPSTASGVPPMAGRMRAAHADRVGKARTATGGRPISTTAQPPLRQAHTAQGHTALSGLQEAALQAGAHFDRVSATRSRWVNGQGADVGCNGSPRSLLRHTANYLVAEQSAGTAPDGARLVDVGGGVGAFTAWLAERLDVPATLVDADPDVLGLARSAFPQLDTRSGLNGVADGSAWLVTAMEVIEHVPPRDQRAFVAELARVVAPGGLLVLSTPDESGYLGRHSGYAPHVGLLDAAGLRRLLATATGVEPDVWRCSGGPFALGRTERVLLPLANRAHALARAAAPRVVDAVSHTVTRVRERGPARPERALPPAEVSLAPADGGNGTGMIAVVRLP